MNSSTVESGACVICFGINIGNILNLKRPLSTLCKKANKVNSVFFFELGFTKCKAKQPLRGMELQERRHEKKITGYIKSV